MGIGIIDLQEKQKEVTNDKDFIKLHHYNPQTGATEIISLNPFSDEGIKIMNEKFEEVFPDYSKKFQELFDECWEKFSADNIDAGLEKPALAPI